MELPQAISAILFYNAEPLSALRLASILKCSESDVREALVLLEEVLEKTGIRLLRNNDEVMLGTTPEAGALIEAMTKEELSKDLSKASLETLAIVLYRGMVTRSEIDYVRGVNSTFILRNLLIRGLVERVENPQDQRSFLYKPTFQLLEYMGVAKAEDLPDYGATIATLAQFVAAKEEPGKKETSENNILAREASDEKAVSAAEENEVGKNFDDEEFERHANEKSVLNS